MFDAVNLDPAQDVNVSPFALYAEAREIAGNEGNALWPGYSDAPFQIILIDGEVEYLVCGEGPGEGFEPAGRNQETGCPLAQRARQFSPTFLASFPAVDFIPTIVVGTPDATGLTPENWRIVLLHEHFHQMQDAIPGAYQAALALDLHGGDETGMWMLNYPFPYEDETVAAAHRAMSDAALRALEADDTDFNAAFADYVARRGAFLASLGDADARYWEFQVWREGVARWTELELSRRASLDAEVRYQWGRLIDELDSVQLATRQRSAVYASGSSDAELLERAGIAWRERYWDEPFTLGPYFPNPE